MSSRITRRGLLSASAAAAITPALLTLTGTKANAVAYAPIMAAAGQVLSFIGSRGNSTSALLLANLTALTAVYEQTVAINRALQGLTIQIAALHEAVLGIPAKTVEEDLLNTLAGNRALVVEYFKAEALNKELGAQIDPRILYDRIKRLFEESFQRARSRFLVHSVENNFVGLADVAVNASFELDLITSLVDRSIDLKVDEFGTGDLLSSVESYSQYFSRSLDIERPGSISQLVASARSKLLEVEKSFGDDAPQPSKTYLGCEYTSHTYLYDTSIWENYDPPQGFFQKRYRIDFQKKFLVIEEKRDFYDLRTYTAKTLTEAGSAEFDVADVAFQIHSGSVDFLLPHEECAVLKFPRPVPKDPKNLEFAFLPFGYVEDRDRKFNSLSPKYAEAALTLLAAETLQEISRHMVANLDCTISILKGDATCIDADS